MESSKEYALRDGPAEASLGVTLRGALAASRSRPLLRGYEVHLGSGVRGPEREVAARVICAAAGLEGRGPPGEGGPARRIIIDADTDADAGSADADAGSADADADATGARQGATPRARRRTLVAEEDGDDDVKTWLE